MKPIHYLATTMLGLAAVGVTDPATAACKSGFWPYGNTIIINQSTGVPVSLVLHYRQGNTVVGYALWRTAGGRDEGPIRGAFFDGWSFSFNINWKNSTVGKYRGRFDEDGIFYGTVQWGYDSRATFKSTERQKCQDR